MDAKNPRLDRFESTPSEAFAATLVARSEDLSDPIRRNDDGWWFWDEIWTTLYGPYESEADAVAALRFYASTL